MAMMPTTAPQQRPGNKLQKFNLNLASKARVIIFFNRGDVGSRQTLIHAQGASGATGLPLEPMVQESTAGYIRVYNSAPWTSLGVISGRAAQFQVCSCKHRDKWSVKLNLMQAGSRMLRFFTYQSYNGFTSITSSSFKSYPNRTANNASSKIYNCTIR